jgi:hypothetical protein
MDAVVPASFGFPESWESDCAVFGVLGGAPWEIGRGFGRGTAAVGGAVSARALTVKESATRVWHAALFEKGATAISAFESRNALNRGSSALNLHVKQEPFGKVIVPQENGEITAYCFRAWNKMKVDI